MNQGIPCLRLDNPIENQTISKTRCKVKTEPVEPKILISPVICYQQYQFGFVVEFML